MYLNYVINNDPFFIGNHAIGILYLFMKNAHRISRQLHSPDEMRALSLYPRDSRQCTSGTDPTKIREISARVSVSLRGSRWGISLRTRMSRRK